MGLKYITHNFKEFYSTGGRSEGGGRGRNKPKSINYVISNDMMCSLNKKFDS